MTPPRWVVALLLAAGCAPAPRPGGGGIGTPAETSSTGGSGTVSTGGAWCALRPDNALIADCRATLSRDEPVTAVLEEPDGSLRALPATREGTEVSLSAWRLLPETTYTVRVGTASGEELSASFTTGPVPDAHAVRISATGTPTWDYLLLPHQCAGGPNMLLLDREGRVTWYLEVAATGMTGAPLSMVDGFDVTPDGVVAVVGRTRLRRWTWDQQWVMDLGFPGELPGPVHHDVRHHDGHDVVLSAEVVTGSDGVDYVMDRVLVFGPDHALVAEWGLADAFAPSGGMAVQGGFWGQFFPGAWDWAHANAVEVDEAGDIYLSSRSFSTVVKVAGWSDPEFGAVRWGLSADPASPLGSDFSFAGDVAPLDFQDQHHPNFDGAGRLLMFDNRAFGMDARATRWDLDQQGMVATLQAAWSLGTACSVQGSAFGLDNDHVVATCAPEQTVYEFSPTRAEPVATMNVLCEHSAGRPLVVRAMPLSFD